MTEHRKEDVPRGSIKVRPGFPHLGHVPADKACILGLGLGV